MIVDIYRRPGGCRITQLELGSGAGAAAGPGPAGRGQGGSWGLLVAGLGFYRVPGPPGGRLCGCQGGDGGDGLAFALLAAGAGADGLEYVVDGGPQVNLGIDHVAAVVQGAAEAGEQLGEDRLDDRLALLVQGLAFGGVQPGGHGLPAGLAGERGRAAALPAGLDRFAGDGDVQL